MMTHRGLSVISIWSCLLQRHWIACAIFISIVVLQVTAFTPLPTDNPIDAAALVDLYDALSGEETWFYRKDQVRWLTPATSFCSWSGIRCICSNNTLCRVQQISVAGNPEYRTQQFIPESIGNFTELASLRLGQNFLSSTIPSSIGNLKKLRVLDLSTNTLTGSVPSSIGNCLQLTHLLLSCNGLSSFSSSIANLNELQVLDISQNKLIEVPSLPSCPAKLKTIFLKSSNFAGVVNASNLRWLCTCPELIKLELSGLAGEFPHWLGFCVPKLSTLQLLYNRFQSADFAESICLSKKINVFIMSFSVLSGTIPECLGNMTQLQMLTLSNNGFESTIPSSLGSLFNLKSLLFQNNRLTGTIPLSFANLTTLKLLNLENNLLTGSLDVLARLPKLTHIVLDDNNFTGSVPTNNFQHIEIMNNSLSGELPLSIFRNGSMLLVLKLSRNQISGTLPDALPSGLAILRLDQNLLSGTLPNSMCDSWTSVTFMNLGNNLLRGTLPSCLGMVQFPSLVTFNLSQNFFTGSLPVSFPNISQGNLQFFDAGGNLLSGTIPSSYEYLDSVFAIDLSHNQFVGTIPSVFNKLKSLSRLDLSGNQFSGSLDMIYQSADFFPSYFNISSNKLTGTIATLTSHQCNSSNSPACLNFAVLDARGNSFDCPMPPYSQHNLLFLRDPCNPPYFSFVKYSIALVCALGVALLFKLLRARMCPADSSEPTSPKLRWLWFMAQYFLTLITLASDVFTMFEIFEYLSSRVDNCDVMNSYQAWNSNPLDVDWYLVNDGQSYAGMPFSMYIQQFIQSRNRDLCKPENSTALGPYDITSIELLNSLVALFHQTCISIQSGCSTRISSEYPTVFAAECFMKYEEQAPFGGTSHKVFFRNFVVIIALRTLIEAIKACIVFVSFFRRSMLGSSWSIDFVGTSIFSPFWSGVWHWDWSRFLSVIVKHTPSYSALAWRVVHQALLCSIPLLCANLYFLFFVSQSGLHVMNMFSVLSACITVPLNFGRAYWAWRSTNRSFSTAEVADILDLRPDNTELDVELLDKSPYLELNENDAPLVY
jgi:Leucine-rich repeat (LRR) protein